MKTIVRKKDRRTFSLLTMIAVFTLLLYSPGMTDPPRQTAPDKTKPTVPDGFTIQRAAGPPETTFPMFATFDDTGRLFVAEGSGHDLYEALQNQTRKCRVRLLEDRNGDGTFEHARVFVDDLVYPMGLAWRDGHLYVADPPDLIKVTDSNGDGRADRRETILTGFGHRDNGSLHGLRFGPDGWLYMTIGWPDGYNIEREDGTTISGNTGAVLRSRPDGSQLDVISRGFENPVEVAFLPTGQIIGTLNWYQEPSGGKRDALVHLEPGGLYPRHGDPGGTPRPVTGPPLPPVTLKGAVAISGICRYRGSGFGESYRNNLFTAQHNTRRIERHVLDDRGATFTSEDSVFVKSEDPNFHPSDVLQDARGDLLVVNTGGWYVEHCPTGRIRDTQDPGGIWRVRRTDTDPQTNPWGRNVSWNDASPEELLSLLKDPRHTVQKKASEKLAETNHDIVQPLKNVLTNANKLTDRIERVIWILGRDSSAKARSALTQVLEVHRKNPEILTLCVKALELHAGSETATAVEPLLRHENAGVRLAAARTLANCKDDSVVSSIIEALKQQGLDAFEQHGLAHALYRLADHSILNRMLQNDHPRLQTVALYLLDNPPHESLTADQVMKRTSADHPELRAAARNILLDHPDWANKAVQLVSDLIHAESLNQEETELLNRYVKLFRSSDRVVELVAESIQDQSNVSSQRRVALIQSMGRMDVSSWPDVWKESMDHLLKNSEGPVFRAAVFAATGSRSDRFTSILQSIARDQAADPDLRIRAWKGIIDREPDLDASSFQLMIDRLTGDEDALQKLRVAGVLRLAKLSPEQARQVFEAVRNDPVLGPGPVLDLHERLELDSLTDLAIDAVASSMEQGHDVSPGTLKTWISTLPQEKREKASTKLLSKESGAQKQSKKLSRYRYALSGGDASRGRNVFFGKGTCHQCHRVNGSGGSVGPDLTEIGNIRSRRSLLESIVLPSATYAQGYRTRRVKTSDDKTITGVIEQKDQDGLLIRDPGGNTVRLSSENIQTVQHVNRSLMPQGLVQLLSKQELTDLLAYLESLQ